MTTTATTTGTLTSVVAVGTSTAALTYRRSSGSGRWTMRRVRARTTSTILRAFTTEAAPSPAWDTWPEDSDPVYAARTALRDAA